MSQPTRDEPHSTYATLTLTSGPSVNRDPLCAICFANMTAAEPVLTHTNGTCLRSFHRACLDAYLDYLDNQGKLPRCPNCRAGLEMRPYDDLAPAVQLRVKRDAAVDEILDVLRAVMTRQLEGDYARIELGFRRGVAELFAAARREVERGREVDGVVVAFDDDAVGVFARMYGQVMQERARLMLAHCRPAPAWYPQFWFVRHRSRGRVHVGVDLSIDGTALSVLLLFIVLCLTWYLKSVTNFEVVDVLYDLISILTLDWKAVMFDAVQAVRSWVTGSSYELLVVKAVLLWLAWLLVRGSVR